MLVAMASGNELILQRVRILGLLSCYSQAAKPAIRSGSSLVVLQPPPEVLLLGDLYRDG